MYALLFILKKILTNTAYTIINFHAFSHQHVYLADKSNMGKK